MSNLRYSIKDLENITQIKAHTIRIWEQRYALLTPKRTETNIRYYNEDDLKKILNINLLYLSGVKISKIASLDNNQIIHEAKSLIINSFYEKKSEIDQLILFILDYNGEEIKNILEQEIKTKSLDSVYENTILPVFQKIGQLWQVNSLHIIQEHYFSNIIREFFITQINTIQTTTPPRGKALLFLHDNEEHEFALLVYYYLLKQKNYDCYYLGAKTPISEISEIFEHVKPHIVVTTLTTKITEIKMEKIEKKLVNFSSHAKVIISGGQVSSLSSEGTKGLIQINQINEFKTWMDRYLKP